MLNKEDYAKIFHEIKNSVALANSYMQLLEKTHPEIAQVDYWNKSMSELCHLRSLLSELSQIRLGREPHCSWTDLCTFLSDCCDSCQRLSLKHHISYTLNVPSTPLWAYIDAIQLRHAITNLLINSCEAIDGHGTIRIEAFAREDEILVSITDTGCGIKADTLEQIFLPFVTTKPEGSGLGLYITKQIIDAHNGNISVSSTQGKGTTFSITLPMADSKI